LVIRAKHEALLFWETRENQHQQRASILYDQALKIDPQYLDAIHGKGNMFQAQLKLDSALIYANRLIDLAPELNIGYGLKAEVYFMKGQFDLAIPNYLKAITFPLRKYSSAFSYSPIERKP